MYFRENKITGEIDLNYLGGGEVTFWKAKKPFGIILIQNPRDVDYILKV